ncbi:MAG: PEP-CTERM sorting domain-containing protein [Akkermansiaceae bacterium]|nr:PEP-CTERM sorting domain-containing protein [Akkermansiaceae bacterium]
MKYNHIPEHRLATGILLAVVVFCFSSITSYSAEVTISLRIELDSSLIEDNNGSVFLDPFHPETGATQFTSDEASGGFSANALSTRLYAEARYESGFLSNPDASVNLNIRDIVTVGHGLEAGNMGIMRFSYQVTGDLKNDVSTPPLNAYGLSEWSLRTRLTSGGFDQTRGGSLRTDTGATGDAIPANTGLTLTYDLPITFGAQFEFHREFTTHAMIDSQSEDLGDASWRIAANLQYSFNYMGAEFLVSDGSGGYTPLDNGDISITSASGSDYRFAGNAPAQVPEPSAGIMLIIAGTLMLGRKRKGSR